MANDKPVLHLMVNNTCTNNCALCCNKQYDVNDIPVVTVKELQSIDTVCLTGGAPMLNLQQLAEFTSNLEKSYPNIENCYIYVNGAELLSIYNELDRMTTRTLFQHFPWNTKVRYGLTMSPKCKNDWDALREFSIYMDAWRSNRIYCFSDEDIANAMRVFRHVNVEMVLRQWQPNFVPAPNTIFRRLPVWIV